MKLDESREARARLSLAGLSVGDAVGEALMRSRAALEARCLPSRRPLPWTDDTAMALSIVEALLARGAIDPDDLAARFAARYRAEPWRGYGRGAHAILDEIAGGAPWQAASRGAFGGEGSMGNGAAMRVAPVGAWHADDLDAVVDAATQSALPTHAHPDGIAGAIAVATAAATAAAMGAGARDGAALFDAVLARTPPGDTHRGIARAARFALDADPFAVAGEVGNGGYVCARDTVPFCIWAAARHLDDVAAAVWTTASVWGDMDTTCAIVGGIVALSAGPASIPADWLAAREPLPL